MNINQDHNRITYWPTTFQLELNNFTVFYGQKISLWQLLPLIRSNNQYNDFSLFFFPKCNLKENKGAGTPNFRKSLMSKGHSQLAGLEGKSSRLL